MHDALAVIGPPCEVFFPVVRTSHFYGQRQKIMNYSAIYMTQTMARDGREVRWLKWGTLLALPHTADRPSTRHD